MALIKRRARGERREKKGIESLETKRQCMTLDIVKNWYELAPTAFCMAMKKLSFREREVLKKRVGINGLSPSTLKQTAESFNVSTSRIRQIEGKACRKMYHLMRDALN